MVKAQAILLQPPREDYILPSLILQIIYNLTSLQSTSSILMLPHQHPALSLVKLEETDSYDEKIMNLRPNYPFFFPMSSILTHQLYLSVKGQIEEYERIQGIQIQPKCSCKHKTKKRGKKQRESFKMQFFEQCQNGLNSQGQKTETLQQKQGRNVNSNLFRMFFRRLEYKIQNEPQLIEEILEKAGCHATLVQFQNWIREEKIDYRNYIRVPHAKRIFCNETEAKRSYAKALRIIFKDFLRKQSVCCYLTSRKIKKEAMKLNLSAVRTIFNDLFLGAN